MEVEFDSIEQALEDVAAGRVVVVVDDEDRENEGDLIVAAQMATPEMIAFFVRHTSGVLCVGMDGERLDQLALPQMVPETDNTDGQGTAFTVSVDCLAGTTTGISAADRCATVRALADTGATSGDFVRPGHVFPLRARRGGVLKRAGHTEAAVDLTRLAGLAPAGLLAEVVNDDGSMARRDQLIEFARTHELRIISIADLIRYRHAREKLVRLVATSRLPLAAGTFTAHVYESVLDGEQHMALVKGDPGEHDSVLVRVHSECLTGDMLGSLRCDCGEQLQQALRKIEEAGCGVLVYLRGHEGRGIGLGHKIRAYSLQDDGQDTVQANLSLRLPVDSREYGIGAQILADLNVRRMRLMSNNPVKFDSLSGFGLEVVERVPLLVTSNPENVRYLDTKRERMGHLLESSDAPYAPARRATVD